MLYQLLAPHSDVLQFFNLFNYITFRTGGATMTAFIISLLIGPSVIRWLKSKQGAGQPIRQDGPETHFKKQGTPTMGGLMIIFSVFLSSVLWADITNPYLWIVLLTFVGFGAIGFADDYKKLIGRSHEGLSGKIRLGLEGLISGAAILTFIHFTEGPMAHGLTIPFFKEVLINLGWFIVPFAIFVIVGTANAVNLTDGLDGLAIGPVMIAAACFGVIAYVTGHVKFAEYLQLHPMPGVGELSIFCGALIGAGLGFLWYNAPPAMVFMGDTGSLATGGALGALAVTTKHELVLAVIGGVFVLETVSVIVQVASFKLTGKRIFKMAPIHHHFEKKGWSEPTIVIRFWIIALVLAMIGLATLKLR